MSKHKNIVIAIYSPPEYYPPTLNAIEYLADVYDHLYIIHRNYDEAFDWVYPPNVSLISSGKKINVRDAERAGLTKKIIFFLQYTAKVFKLFRKTRPDTILLYDYMPVLSIRILFFFARKPRLLWYHNHDVGDETYLRKWSLSWLAWKSEKWIFPRLDFFSLPSLERKVFFPMEKLKGKFLFLPNFPSLKVYKQILGEKKKETGAAIKLLYQGSIGPLHGLEEIIPILNEKIAGKELRLIIKGFISEDYLAKLRQIATEHAVSDKMEYKPPTGYREVIQNAFSCHIGIGIHRKQDIMNQTLGTSSNKIYEYAASGMPVLLYDNNHFRKHLGKFEWAFFTDCSNTSVLDCLEKIIAGYDYLSAKARKDFEEGLNFEHYLKPIIDELMTG